jgi:hypothetical protein
MSSPGGVRSFAGTAVIAAALGMVCVGWDCGGTSTTSVAADASGGARVDSGSHAASDQAERDATPDRRDTRDTGNDAPKIAVRDTGTAPACIPDNGLCSDGGPLCCNTACSAGVCGSCRAEGTQCGAADHCCNGLSCNVEDAGVSYCGTNLCEPDGTPCSGGDVICCNDDCNNGTCGG